jgi:hypothetical protein
MSEESTTADLVLWRQAIEAGSARDIEATMRFFAPDSVWDNSSVGLGVVEGPRRDTRPVRRLVGLL